MGPRLKDERGARPDLPACWKSSSFETPCEAAWLLRMRGVNQGLSHCCALDLTFRMEGQPDRTQAPAIPRLSPGVCWRADGGRGAPGRRCFSKRWVTTRRSSLGDFGHSRLALRREGSDRHRGCYPPIPRGKVAPPFAGTVSSVPKGGVLLSRGQVFHPAPARRVAPVAGADENPPPARPRGFHPPTYAPRHPQRVHGGTPSPSRLKALSDTAPA